MNNSNKLVVKDNALIDASFNLSLVEQRIMLLAIVEAREVSKLTPNTAIEVLVSNYVQQFKADSNNIYGAIKEAARTLKRREFSYLDRYKGQPAYTTANWVNKVTYVDNNGMVVLYFSEEVISLISRLEEQFTKYHLEQVSSFKSKYSTRLYELIVKWLSTGKTEKYEIEDLRSKLGLGVNEYSTMSNFKINVLDKALGEINQHSDLTVSYEQFKQGRAISAVQFKIEQKQQPKKQREVTSKDQNTIDMFCNLTEAQISKYSIILSKEHSISDLAGTKDYLAFQSWLANILRDPKGVSKGTADRIFTTLREKTDFGK
ncbi:MULTISPECIES: replication initiation protein RepM [unclassified Acinetobacter]|uniref:replication initiation protein RepM n=2 Tax=Acinetobacter TaxID=469 RepID=UPI0015D2C3AF|nr:MULTISPECIES: replication initiation protein RepM [unclassified Acinetobacter]